MSKFAVVLAGLIVPAFIMAGFIATPAMAQEKMAAKKMEKAKAGEVVLKEIAQNDKVRVYEATFKPGDISPNTKRPMRVVHVLKGGTLERTYEDGKREPVVLKAGETTINNVEKAYALKNIGKTTIHLVVVALK